MSYRQTSDREDPIKHLRTHMGKTLVETVTDSAYMNKIMGQSALERLEKIKSDNMECTVVHNNCTAYVYA